MNNNYTNIDEYINTFPIEIQSKLIELRNFIRKESPKETTETIAYKMPTFRYNGNLIHFAQQKQHIGIYPGSDAIDNFKEDLTNYKITKGTITIQTNQTIPFDIIKKIINYNATKLKNKKEVNWHKYNSKWENCISLMENILSKTELKREFKWGSDIFTYNKKNIIGWGGFKNFFSLWFYNGVFLNDEENVLIAASEGKTKALRQWRFSNVNEMDENKILTYILESIETVKNGKSIKITKSEKKDIPLYFKNYLSANDAVNKCFQNLTEGRKKEYITYIEEAKQEKTKETRLQKITPIILSGKGLNDRYKK